MVAPDSTPADEPWRHEEAVANGVRLHYVAAGDPADPTVVLCHGFPAFWYDWHRLIPALADAGFHVLAPDLRGYNRSEKPPGVASYDVAALVGDVAGLVEEVGDGPARAVVGHDWGGVVAWEFGSRRPGAVERLAVLNAPHLGAYRRALRRPEQLARSWYVGFFQLPWLPEAVLGADGCRPVADALRATARSPDAFDEADRRRYREAFCRPGVRRAAVSYYRALFRRTLREAVGGVVPGAAAPAGPRSGGRVDVPSLLVWGERDVTLTVGLTEGLKRWVPDCRVERLPDAGHWVHHDAPGVVTDLLVEFLSADDG